MELKFVAVTLISICLSLFVIPGQASYHSFYRSRSRELRPRSYQRPRLSIQSQSSQSRPNYLDPMNFQLPDMTLNHMERILQDIEMHIRPKENNLEFYSGARLLILLLQEECFRMRAAGNPNLRQFCNSFSSRFRSFF